MYRNGTFVKHQIYFLINIAVIYSNSSAPWGEQLRDNKDLLGHQY